MGVASSKSEQSLEVDITSQSFAKCPNINIGNSITITDVSHRPDLNASCNGHPTSFEVNQNAGASSECVINNLQNISSDVIAKLDAEAQANLGFAFSENSNDILTQIDSMTESSCGDLSSDQSVALKDVVITACDVRIIQDATIKSNCVLDSLQTIANKASVESNANASGTSLWEGIFGTGTSWLILIVAIIVVLIIIYMFMYSSPSETTATPNTTGTSSSTTSSTTSDVTNASNSLGIPDSFSSYVNQPTPGTSGEIMTSTGSTGLQSSAPSGISYGPEANPNISSNVPSSNGYVTPSEPTNPFSSNYEESLRGGLYMIGGAVCSMGPVVSLGILLFVVLAIRTRKELKQNVNETFNNVKLPPSIPYNTYNVLPSDRHLIDKDLLPVNPLITKSNWENTGFIPYNLHSDIYNEAHQNGFMRPSWAEKEVSVNNGVISVYYKYSGELVAQAPRRHSYEQNGVYFNLLSDGSELISDIWGRIATVPAYFVTNDRMTDYWTDYY